MDDLSVRSARQVEVPHEHVTRIAALVSIARVAVALGLSRVIVAIAGILFRVVVSRTGRLRTSPNLERILIVSIAGVVIAAVARIVTPARIVATRHLDLHRVPQPLDVDVERLW